MDTVLSWTFISKHPQKFLILTVIQDSLFQSTYWYLSYREWMILCWLIKTNPPIYLCFLPQSVRLLTSKRKHSSVPWGVQAQTFFFFLIEMNVAFEKMCKTCSWSCFFCLSFCWGRFCGFFFHSVGCFFPVLLLLCLVFLERLF